MYAERETGGFARTTSSQVSEAFKDASGDVAPAEGRVEQGQPVRLPATIATQAPAAKRSPRVRRLAMIGAAFLIVASAAGTYGHHWWTVGRFIESTDDAYVGAH